MIPRHASKIAIATFALTFAASAHAGDRDISELFDPAILTQEICGLDGAMPREDYIQLAALPADSGTRAPLWPGLGNWSFKISTKVKQAQAYFDQGLRLSYGFNHGEAARSFRAAQELDPNCAICFWGEALVLGPNINERMTDDLNPVALKAIGTAQRLARRASAKERALIAALATRYSADPKIERTALDSAYADAMAKVYKTYSNDMDVATLYAEAAMDASPRPWWGKDGVTPIGRAADVVATIEKVLAKHPEHPGAVHFYIHVMEPTATPEKAAPYADTLAGLMPAAGHMVHMPSHTYFRIGRYKDSLASNVAAVAADEALLAQLPTATDRYRFGYYPHNVDMALASAEMAGDPGIAFDMSKRLLAAVVPGRFRDEQYTAKSIFPHVRFATPDALLALPRPPEKMAYATGMWRYARASAYAWQKNFDGVRVEREALNALRNGEVLKAKDRNRDRNVLEVADNMIAARVALAQNDVAAAQKALEAAIAIGDKEGYWRGDPPAWHYPIRQALGIMLVQNGRAAEAIPILRQALIDTPNNGWVLFALQRAAVMTGDSLGAEQYGKLFANAWSGPNPPDLSRI